MKTLVSKGFCIVVEANALRTSNVSGWISVIDWVTCCFPEKQKATVASQRPGLL